MKKYIKLSNKFRVEKLIYNYISKTVITQVRSCCSKLCASGIYYRSIDKKEYCRIRSIQNVNNSFESVVSSGTSSKVYFIVEERRKRRPTTISSNWVEIRCYNLKTKQSYPIIGIEKLNSLITEKRAWVTELLALSSDETSLFCKMGFEHYKGDRGFVEYYICKLNFKSLYIKKLTLLQNIFY